MPHGEASLFAGGAAIEPGVEPGGDEVLAGSAYSWDIGVAGLRPGGAGQEESHDALMGRVGL